MAPLNTRSPVKTNSPAVKQMLPGVCPGVCRTSRLNPAMLTAVRVRPVRPGSGHVDPADPVLPVLREPDLPVRAQFDPRRIGLAGRGVEEPEAAPGSEAPDLAADLHGEPQRTIRPGGDLVREANQPDPEQ